MDTDLLYSYIQALPFAPVTNEVDLVTLANDLHEGKIIGVAREKAEHGPRALGNRSILCNPSIADMKDILNAKVKNREWYRPFAPVVRLEDVNTYFEWNGESRWMSFCPKVREEWKEKLAAITHVDGTARVQTVTREQNEWLYDLLTEFEKVNGIGVLLNTSFNINGKPILSTVREAFEVFKNTALDGLVIENNYILKD
jgi:carbamoyltransferase